MNSLFFWGAWFVVFFFVGIVHTVSHPWPPVKEYLILAGASFVTTFIVWTLNGGPIFFRRK